MTEQTRKKANNDVRLFLDFVAAGDSATNTGGSLAPGVSQRLRGCLLRMEGIH